MSVRNEKGMVLLLVLVVVALLASLVTEFAFSTLVDLRLTETFRDSTRAWYLARGGVQAGRMILQENRNAYDHPAELWGVGVPAFPVGEEGTVSIAIDDLNSRLDLNSLVRQGENVNGVLRDILVRLFQNLGLEDPEGLVAALIDWIDTDSEVTEIGNAAGAEEEYYQRLEKPYAIRNGWLTSLDELLLVRGFTPEVYQRIAPFVTLYGSTTLNINTASPEVLLAMDPAVESADIETLVEHRRETPFQRVDDLGQLLGPQSPTYSVLKSMQEIAIGVKSSGFRITVEATVNEGVRRVTAFVDAKGKNIYYMKVD